MTATQPTLPLFKIAEPDPNVPFLISVLKGQGWMLRKEICAQVLARTGVVWNERKVRALASACKWRVHHDIICGGDLGYKLGSEMTADEIKHWRNRMMSQIAEEQGRVLDADQFWFIRQPIQQIV